MEIKRMSSSNFYFLLSGKQSWLTNHLRFSTPFPLNFSYLLCEKINFGSSFRKFFCYIRKVHPPTHITTTKVQQDATNCLFSWHPQILEYSFGLIFFIANAFQIHFQLLHSNVFSSWPFGSQADLSLLQINICPIPTPKLFLGLLFDLGLQLWFSANNVIWVGFKLSNSVYQI